MRAQYWRVQTKTKRQFGSMIILGTAAMLCAIHLVQNMPSPVTFTQLLDMISASTHSAPWVTRHLFVCIRLYFLHCWQAILFRAQRPGRVVCWVEWCRCFRNVRGNRSSWRCYGEKPFFKKKCSSFPPPPSRHVPCTLEIILTLPVLTCNVTDCDRVCPYAVLCFARRLRWRLRNTFHPE